MRKHIEQLQYISHEFAPLTQVEQIMAVCQAGAKWVQYRSLEKDDIAILSDLEQISSICDDWGTTLIVTDHFHLKDQADIQGFHLDSPEADSSNLRDLLGDQYIIGASATNIEQLKRHAQSGVDYIGLGPFNKSQTKPNSYDLLSFQDYYELKAHLDDLKLNVPIIAVGGIKMDNVNDLLSTGIHGIAISASIYTSNDLELEYSDFYKRVLDVSLNYDKKGYPKFR